MIKRCNDFGAGGVSVAIGELADGLKINLDSVPKKYEGLDGTELAISESQERMAVVVKKEDVVKFIEAARDENLEASTVADVTAEPRLSMVWRGKTIVSLSREFLNTNGVKQNSNIIITAPSEDNTYFKAALSEQNAKDLEQKWVDTLKDLNVCSQKGLIERFDASIGAGSVLMPFGGKCQLSPAEGMAAKIPVLNGDTTTGTIMTYGYNPLIAKWSPFHGAVFAVVESVAKIVAMGGNYKTARLTLQEYFEKLGKDPKRWGKPFSALLGAYYAQMKLGIPAIGGKDSMSGTFKDMNVPPTLVSFAVDIVDVRNVVSTEFKNIDSNVVLVALKRDANELPDFDNLDKNYTRINEIMSAGKVLAAQTVRSGGLVEAISKMSFGNMIGFTFKGDLPVNKLFAPEYGSIVLEINKNEDLSTLFAGIDYEVLGTTQKKEAIDLNGVSMSIKSLIENWEEPLEKIFPTRTEPVNSKPKQYGYEIRNTSRPKVSYAKPRIFIPVFPGTNCEYDTAKAFERAGGQAEIFVIKNLSSSEIDKSVDLMAKTIDNSQIIMIPGGFSGGDEPDGSGKFIATAFRNPKVKDAVMRLLKERDGLMLGICNGFQALIKLGLVPYGEIRDLTDESPTLTFNTIGRHVSCMVNTRVSSTLSPWFSNLKVGDIHSIAVSHGEGRFVASEEVLKALEKNGQIATQYVDLDGNSSYDIRFNPNGSFEAIEGITSPDGRVLGKMGHSERIGTNVVKNVPGEKDQKLFEAGVNYFK